MAKTSDLNAATNVAHNKRTDKDTYKQRRLAFGCKGNRRSMQLRKHVLPYLETIWMLWVSRHTKCRLINLVVRFHLIRIRMIIAISYWFTYLRNLAFQAGTLFYNACFIENKFNKFVLVACYFFLVSYIMYLFDLSVIHSSIKNFKKT